MNRLLTTLLLSTALVAATFGQATTHVIDNARLLGNRADDLNASLQGSSVWVETFVAPPGGNLQGYAEGRIQQLTGASAHEPEKPGFLIAITTNPRKWEIRMYPVGVVPGSATEPIGNAMGAAFRGGDLYGGIARAASQLDALLSAPRPVAEPVPDRQMVQMTPEEREALIKTRQEAREAEERFEAASRRRNLSAAVLGLAVLAIIIIVAVVSYRERVKAREEEDRLEREESNRRWEAAQAERERKRAEREARERERAKVAKERAAQEVAAARQDPAKVQAAEKVFNRFTPTERQAICNSSYSSPYHSSSASMDPLLFYILGMHVGGFDHAGNVPPPPAPTPVRDDSYRRSDTSYTSSSYDSGSSSSFDSGSSSSDSGSGGSW